MAQASLFEKSDEWAKQGVFHAARLKVDENRQEALQIARIAIQPFPNWEASKSAEFLKRIESGKIKDLKVSFGIYGEKKQMLYSIKLEANGSTEILTVRVGSNFTEVSLEQNGRFVEIMRQQDKKVTYWRG
ncbi:MAG: hypothetical protein QW275_01755 [Candidatus Anstonellaceae archaeon]